MLNWDRAGKFLNIPLPEELREMLTPNTGVSIVSAESLFSQTPAHTTYEWYGGLSSNTSGCLAAMALGPCGWQKLEIQTDWSNARGEQYESTVPPIGEQLESLGVLRPALIVLLEHDSDGEGRSSSTLTIGIGGKSIRRYLQWRIMTAAREMCGLLSELEPLCPQRPAAASGSKRSRRRLLDSAGK